MADNYSSDFSDSMPSTKLSKSPRHRRFTTGVKQGEASRESKSARRYSSEPRSYNEKTSSGDSSSSEDGDTYTEYDGLTAYLRQPTKKRKYDESTAIPIARSSSALSSASSGSREQWPSRRSTSDTPVYSKFAHGIKVHHKGVMRLFYRATISEVQRFLASGES